MSCALSAADPDPGDNLPEIRTREIYVPYAEFLKVASKDPNATLMTLDEYRALVAEYYRQISKDRAAPPAVKPPPK
jgi:hypothetical protein